MEKPTIFSIFPRPKRSSHGAYRRRGLSVGRQGTRPYDHTRPLDDVSRLQNPSFHYPYAPWCWNMYEHLQQKYYPVL